MVEEALEVLDTLCSDQCWVAEAAADAERHQQSAGLASRLSTADLQRLCLLLHLRCASMAACSARQVSGQQARAQELQLAALADVDKLVSLQGGGPAPLMYLHWRGVIQNERRLHTQSVASLEAALAACQATPGEGGVLSRQHSGWGGAAARCIACSIARSPPICLCLRLLDYPPCLVARPPLLSAASLMEASAAMLLASQLKLTGAGGRWSAAHAHELLARAQRALARCKPWLPKPVTRKFQLMAYAIEAEVTALAAATRGASLDSLPAGSPARLTCMRFPDAVLPICASCGQPSPVVKKCAACKAVAYW